MTPHDVAQWMLDRLHGDTCLYQDVVVYDIQQRFGEEFAYINDHGNLAIDKGVLNEFRKLTEGSVVWEKGERCWRLRKRYDTPASRETE